MSETEVPEAEQYINEPSNLELEIAAELDSLFAECAAIDVSKYVSTVTTPKKQFDYLPWAIAVALLKMKCPEATFEIVKHPEFIRNTAGDVVGTLMVPYLNAKVGYFVEVAVTANEVRMAWMLPILDNKNIPIGNPNTGDINKTAMRCLVKVIAIHTGVGVSLFAKETFLEDDSRTQRPPAPKGNEAVDPEKKAIVDQITARGNAIAVSFADITKAMKKQFKKTQIFDLSIEQLKKLNGWLLKVDADKLYAYLKEDK